MRNGSKLRFRANSTIDPAAFVGPPTPAFTLAQQKLATIVTGRRKKEYQRISLVSRAEARRARCIVFHVEASRRGSTGDGRKTEGPWIDTVTPERVEGDRLRKYSRVLGRWDVIVTRIEKGRAVAIPAEWSVGWVQVIEGLVFESVLPDAEGDVLVALSAGDGAGFTRGKGRS
ncbi:MAG: hypothetical protein KJ749_09715, partial [Planctomycetes bacterium]|nr:hypothetical protein [Planctomycetota bacterium]